MNISTNLTAKPNDLANNALVPLIAMFSTIGVPVLGGVLASSVLGTEGLVTLAVGAVVAVLPVAWFLRMETLKEATLVPHQIEVLETLESQYGVKATRANLSDVLYDQHVRVNDGKMLSLDKTRVLDGNNFAILISEGNVIAGN